MYRPAQDVDVLNFNFVTEKISLFHSAMCQKLYTFDGEIGAGRYGTFQNYLLVVTTTSKSLSAYFLVAIHINYNAQVVYRI